MNLVDVILILIMFMAVWSGYRRGFILGILDLATWIGCLAAVFLLYPYVSGFLDKYLPSLGAWSILVAFLATLFIVRLIIAGVVNRFLETVPHNVHYNFINKISGVIPGLVNGLVYAALFATLLLLLPVSSSLTNKVQDSPLANKFSEKVAWVESNFSPLFNQNGKNILNKLTIDPESEKTVQLNFKVKNAKVNPRLEAEMLNMVNQERKKAGLKSLKADTALRAVARAHSKDMFMKGYFSHISPDGDDPFDRMREAHLVFMTAGENLALAPTLPIAHQGLMNSPGHRANILQPAFGRIGIGILDGGIYGLMITQDFRN